MSCDLSAENRHHKDDARAHIEEGARNIGSPDDETLAARDHHERRIAGELHP
jgi:hypothetical protein